MCDWDSEEGAEYRLATEIYNNRIKGAKGAWKIVHSV